MSRLTDINKETVIEWDFTDKSESDLIKIVSYHKDNGLIIAKFNLNALGDTYEEVTEEFISKTLLAYGNSMSFIMKTIKDKVNDGDKDELV